MFEAKLRNGDEGGWMSTFVSTCGICARVREDRCELLSERERMKGRRKGPSGPPGC
jgi:hypothetical protein